MFCQNLLLASQIFMSSCSTSPTLLNKHQLQGGDSTNVLNLTALNPPNLHVELWKSHDLTLPGASSRPAPVAPRLSKLVCKRHEAAESSRRRDVSRSPFPEGNGGMGMRATIMSCFVFVVPCPYIICKCPKHGLRFSQNWVWETSFGWQNFKLFILRWFIYIL